MSKALQQSHHFLSNLIHTKLISHLKDINFRPQFIVSINLSESALIELKQLFPAVKIKEYSLAYFMNSEQSILNESIDLVVTDLSFIDNGFDEERFFLEIKRILTQNGLLVFSVFDHSNQAALLQELHDQQIIDDKEVFEIFKKMNVFRFLFFKEPIFRIERTLELIHCILFFVSKVTATFPIEHLVLLKFPGAKIPPTQIKKPEIDHEHEEASKLEEDKRRKEREEAEENDMDREDVIDDDSRLEMAEKKVSESINLINANAIELKIHEEKLLNHVESTAMMMNRLLSLDLSHEENQEKLQHFIQHLETHKATVEKFDALHTEHKELLNQLIDTEQYLEKNNYETEHVRSFIEHHQEVVLQHEEKLQQHTEFLNNEIQKLKL